LPHIRGNFDFLENYPKFLFNILFEYKGIERFMNSLQMLFGFVRYSHVLRMGLGRRQEGTGARDRTQSQPGGRPVSLRLAVGDVWRNRESIHWLEAAYEYRLPFLPWLLAWHEESKAYWDDPRVQLLIDNTNLQPIIDARW